MTWLGSYLGFSAVPIKKVRPMFRGSKGWDREAVHGLYSLTICDWLGDFIKPYLPSAAHRKTISALVTPIIILKKSFRAFSRSCPTAKSMPFVRDNTPRPSRASSSFTEFQHYNYTSLNSRNTCRLETFTPWCFSRNLCVLVYYF